MLNLAFETTLATRFRKIFFTFSCHLFFLLWILRPFSAIPTMCDLLNILFTYACLNNGVNASATVFLRGPNNEKLWLSCALPSILQVFLCVSTVVARSKAQYPSQ